MHENEQMLQAIEKAMLDLHVNKAVTFDIRLAVTAVATRLGATGDHLEFAPNCGSGCTTVKYLLLLMGSRW